MKRWRFYSSISHPCQHRGGGGVYRRPASPLRSARPPWTCTSLLPGVLVLVFSLNHLRLTGTFRGGDTDALKKEPRREGGREEEEEGGSEGEREEGS